MMPTLLQTTMVILFYLNNQKHWSAPTFAMRSSIASCSSGKLLIIMFLKRGTKKKSRRVESGDRLNGKPIMIYPLGKNEELLASCEQQLNLVVNSRLLVPHQPVDL
jgi:hypothetical protein